MNRVKTAFFAFACILLFLGAAPAEDDSGGIRWITGTTKALQASGESGRPVLVDLWAVWCEPCKVMEKTTFRDSRVLEAVEGFVPLKVDADADTVFVERYGIEIFPTTLFLDEQGREITRMTGLVEADPLLEKLEAVRGGYASYLEQVERRGDPQAMKEAGIYLLKAGNGDGAVPLLRKALKQLKGQETTETEETELALSEALLASGRTGAAAKGLERLSSSATSVELRERAFSRLKEEFPERAAQLER
jgi:thioredoxin-like negative regulator of GroEL